MDFSGKLYRFKWALITLRLSPLTKSLGQNFPVTVYDNCREPDPWTLTLVRECLYSGGHSVPSRYSPEAFCSFPWTWGPNILSKILETMAKLGPSSLVTLSPLSIPPSNTIIYGLWRKRDLWWWWKVEECELGLWSLREFLGLRCWQICLKKCGGLYSCCAHNFGLLLPVLSTFKQTPFNILLLTLKISKCYLCAPCWHHCWWICLTSLWPHEGETVTIVTFA